MTQGQLKIQSENILPIIKQWLYSDKDIFVRELVSNACDALQKLKLLRDQGKSKVDDNPLRIDLKIDSEKKTVTFADNGLGMTSEEVEKYITELAFSGAEDFIKNYQTDDDKNQIIGHFGLGFYSAFMAGKQVDIHSLSYKQESKPVFWSCDGSSEYSIEEGSKESRGTEIVLHIHPEEEEYLNPSRLKTILKTYCSFLPFEIYLDGEQINETPPLWVKSPSECTDEDYLNFYKKLYPMEEDPLFWIHLNVDYPFNLQGILYFPKVKKELEMQKNSIQLFCNRVFVSDNCKDILPDFLTMLKGVIDSPDIPLNVSRSHLQVDRTVKQVSSHISKKVSDRLSNLFTTDRDKFIESWKDTEIIVKLGAMQEDKFFDRIKDVLIWKNLDGSWTTLKEYLERNNSKHENKIYYTSSEKDLSHFANLYKENNIEVLATSPFIDSHFFNHLEGKMSPTSFQRIDASIDDAIIDSSKEQNVLDQDGKTQASKIADFIGQQLEIKDLNVEAKSLASESLPGFVMIEESTRRFRDAMRAATPNSTAEQFATKKTFVINTNSKLVNNIQKISGKNPNLAKELTKHTYDLALLSQKELQAEEFENFIQDSQSLMQSLVQELA
jgi:molecular chaperone HtpG